MIPPTENTISFFVSIIKCLYIYCFPFFKGLFFYKTIKMKQHKNHLCETMKALQKRNNFTTDDRFMCFILMMFYCLCFIFLK